MRGNMDRVMECTSSNFDGIIALMDPSRSWVSKWNHLEAYYPGIYASYVSGRIPEDVEDMLVEHGVTYYPKDGTQDD
ncbi:hypothetical protein BB561_003860 [Smittium simulii]|uniref:Transcription elongation factor SPT4 n=1 Tax=Smittium simulii TaxID=133385 RepID=A0A2T9YJ74_9FUNG|nr:hypothetical protein BB561_003860 [Smittium simulii]